MAVFIVIGRKASPELDSAIQSAFTEEKRWKYSDNVWFVISNDSPKSICDDLGIKKGGITGTIVMRGTAMYYGVANAAMWEWLKSEIERSSDD